MLQKNNSIEVFQDLFLMGPAERLAELREALRQRAEAPWCQVEDEIPDSMAFGRESGDGIAASSLTLWKTPSGYKVTNIVPIEKSELSVSEYNDVLNDFVDRVTPVLNDLGFQVEISERERPITDWTSQEAAEALRMFSVGANKSTGSSHPSDQERWFQFLFAAYRAHGELDPYLLKRWLEEVEKWPPDVASDLVLEYEFALSLLSEYDRFIKRI